MTLQILFAIVGTLAGLVYAALGLSAARHLNDSASEADKVVNWSLWWWAEPSKYKEEGRRLCTVGGIAFAIAAIAWLLSAVI